MPVSIYHMRSILVPGLASLRSSIIFTDEEWAAAFAQDSSFGVGDILAPKLNMKEALVAGAGLALLKNPRITRRFWQW